MQESFKEITEKFDIEIKNIIPYKNAYLLYTQEGRKLLKKNPHSIERIYFVHGAKEHLYRNGFTNIDRYFCTIQGTPYVSAEGINYTLTDLIDGSECNFDNSSHVALAARLLAAFHEASRGYIPLPESRICDELGKLPDYFLKRLNEIKKLKRVARKCRNKFDYLFMEHVDYFLELGENAIDMLKESAYGKLVELARENKMLCHHDFTNHNIVCGGDMAYLINFEYCCYELNIYDIANFLRRKMRRCNWDFIEARFLLKEYMQVKEIDSDEFHIMKIILLFPQKFWRVSNQYYNSNHSWSEKVYVIRLQEVINEVGHLQSFMEKFDMLI